LAATPDISLIIPCFDAGARVAEAARYVDEGRTMEVVVVDDGSAEAETLDALDALDAAGTNVIRHDRNLGVSAARNSGLAAARGEYVFPLDADDLIVPGALTRMAAKLDANRNAAACFGNYAELGEHWLVRRVPERLDPYRVALTNEYPASAMFRRAALERHGGWHRLLPHIDAQSDWDLWMTLAEAGETAVHLGEEQLVYVYDAHRQGLAEAGRRRGAELYRAMRARHPGLFGSLRTHRRHSDLGRARRLLYPLVYGQRPRSRLDVRVKALLDRTGIWTSGTAIDEARRRQIDAALAQRARDRPG
jgi:glycosyltransferase involved in cell wall biosynthesis